MVRIRLMRMGKTKRPAYRVVVADSRGPRDGRFIENIGRYQPLEDPSVIEIDEDRALYWLSQGAQPSEQVQTLLKVQGIWERFSGSRAPARRAGSSERRRGSEGGASEAAEDSPASPTPPGAEESAR
jgi:small subunit ribosomal protein S16